MEAIEILEHTLVHLYFDEPYSDERVEAMLTVAGLIVELEEGWAGPWKNDPIVLR